MYQSQNQIRKYVPRHFRLGTHAKVVQYDITQDVVESIPIVDDDGSVVQTEPVIKAVPAHEVMQKYKLSAFRLSALVKNGVPLKMVNINKSNFNRIDDLVNIAQRIDNADDYVKRVLAQQEERKSWFSEPAPGEESIVES